MRAEADIKAAYSVVIVTLDAHAAGPAARISPRLARDFPGLSVSVHAAAEWAENPAALARARDAVDHADIVVANLLFIEEHLTAILPNLQAARDRADAFVGVIADPVVPNFNDVGAVAHRTVLGAFFSDTAGVQLVGR
jgi:magnesium chelatase subunit H